MKNLLKLLGIIAVIAMVGFTLASCGGGATTPAEVPAAPDDTVWETVRNATASVNGLEEAVSGRDKGQTRPLYATGSKGIEVTDGVADLSDAELFTDENGEKIVYVPAIYKGKDVTATTGPASEATIVIFLPINTDLNAKKEYKLKKIGGIGTSVTGTNYEFKKDDAGEATDEKVYTFVIPEGVTEISDSAFASNTGITAIEFPKTLTKIGDSAFAGIKFDGPIYIPSTVKNIGASAFADSESVDIVVPASVTTIGAAAFSGVHAVVVNGASTAPKGWDEGFAGDLIVIYNP